MWLGVGGWQILARDRLVGSYQVKPKMNRLKQTLALMASTSVALVVLLPAQRDMDTVMYSPSRNGSEAIAAGRKPSSKKVDILNFPAEVMYDDDMVQTVGRRIVQIGTIEH
ncbi:hypothetical protein KC19_VG032500 [Ceratodon purpureus]|uniref:Uncharacterized protein n=1 Tax=Ceratodon purpureus TaxID=3225 RepID=A0A8T0HLH8_CERPU|nr:hypothetical protein KC19_VG032500 [Ceratodon purpureus]